MNSPGHRVTQEFVRLVDRIFGLDPQNDADVRFEVKLTNEDCSIIFARTETSSLFEISFPAVIADGGATRVVDDDFGLLWRLDHMIQVRRGDTVHMGALL